ncbi:MULTISPECIES: NUDIX domain-containing protein [unclassified Xanthobacter]|uniref:NUDIX domain-containing protein n=1 Tax=unclassified Xanthobacter TaxID=2623496 RepID=UPI001F317C7C|nr:MULTISPECIES: NUDIX domain-containing protein [unclassified Xanthobacter]
MSKMDKPPLPGDGPADVDVQGPTLIAPGYRPYERYVARLLEADGSVITQTRDILRGGRVVGVLAFDPARDQVVLVRQFRLPAYLALGRERSDLVEIVAGGVEAGEADEAAARRECVEETGLAPGRMVPLMRLLPTPGITDEQATLFLAQVDASRLPERAGLAEEDEVIRPLALSVDDALDMLSAGRCANGYLIIALQWLALNRGRLPGLLAA